ncbi:hypothetical protein CEE37_10895 [candidate division LCP-89 bacterium B3_LCP]|uniref:Fibronectin type-III domain-containing protein n=1 Tax=candidate division LCP-89 bacterium B3_LCP TaxID=2012998 RepID=A0A532UXU9_UNCL8|nr:MAG: hypothetical protein CEE37_10895 [candidate division LCP-89 bacterium B3_LCP]
MKTLPSNSFIAFTISLLVATAALSSGIITSFDAAVEGELVILEWTSGLEDGLDHYQVERSLDGLAFFSIADVAALGNNTTYFYEDHDIYKGSTRTYYYRIKAAMLDGTANYSSVQSVTLTISGIQQTWGSIKALFR